VTSPNPYAQTGLELQVFDLLNFGFHDTLSLPAGAGYRDADIDYTQKHLVLTRSTGQDVTVVDLSQAGEPILDGSIAVSSASGVEVQGLQLVVGSSNTTRVYDLSAGPNGAALLGSIALGGATPTVTGDFLWTTGQQSTAVIRMTDPGAMKVLARTGRLAIEEGLLVIGKHVFAQDRSELSIIEMQ
jgi:hypothetical protein